MVAQTQLFGIQWCDKKKENLLYNKDWSNTYTCVSITSYARNKNFFECYLVYNGVYLILLGSLLEKLDGLVSICIMTGDWFCITTFDVLSAFHSVYV